MRKDFLSRVQNVCRFGKGKEVRLNLGEDEGLEGDRRTAGEKSLGAIRTGDSTKKKNLDRRGEITLSGGGQVL